MVSKSSGARQTDKTLPPDVEAIYRALGAYLTTTDDQGRRWCSAKCGVYAFYDYDLEPIYIGQTKEQLTTRIRRHMTNQRTDAVAMRVLDPLEVAEIEVWPFWDFQLLNLRTKENSELVKQTLNAAEYTLYRNVIAESAIGRVLNEKVPTPTELIDLPPSFRGSIIPDSIRERLSHPDERIARRALKIAELAGIIRQRDVSVGLRNTLVTQAERLQLLANERFLEVTGQMTPEQRAVELIGSENQEEEEEEV